MESTGSMKQARNAARKSANREEEYGEWQTEMHEIPDFCRQDSLAARCIARPFKRCLILLVFAL